MLIRRTVFAAAFALLCGGGARAQSPVWVPTAAGTYTWNQPTNWNPNTVPLSGNPALSQDITGNQIVNLDVVPTLSGLVIGDTSATTPFGFTLNPGSGGPITFSGVSGPPLLSSLNGANVISVPIVLATPMTVTHTASAGLGSLTLSGAVDLGSNTMTVGATSSGGISTVTGGVVISGAVTGSGGVTKLTGGFLTLTAANSYSGTTAITGGAVRLTGAGTLGSGNLNMTGGQFFPGASFTRALGTGPNQVQLSGTTGFGTIDQPLVVNFGEVGGVGQQVVWGTNGFNPTVFQLSSGSSNNTVTVANPIDLNGGSREVRAENATTVTIDATLSGVISGAGTLTASSLGILALTGDNTYTGQTIVTTTTGGVLRVGSNNALGSTAGTTLIKGGTTSASSRVDLAPGVTTPETFEVEGKASNTVVAIQTAAGTGTSTATGNIVFVDGGAGNNYNLAPASGTVLNITGNVTNGLGTSGTARTLNLIGNGVATLSGNISNATGADPIAVVKSAGSVWTLAGTNTYTGATTVSGGTLVMNGSLSAGSNGVTVTGGTLAGTGTINRAVTMTAGVLAPGPTAGPAGVLTVTGPVNVAAAATVRFRVVGGNPSNTPGGSTDTSPGTNPTTNTLLRLGTSESPLTFASGSTVNVVGTGVTFQLNQQYSYRVAEGTVNGDLNAVALTYTGVTVDTATDSLTYDGTALYVTFTPVPEPTTVLAVAAVGLVAVRRVRRFA